MDAAQAFWFAHPFWVWLAVGAVFLAVELATGSGWLLWPAGSAAIVAFVTLALRLGGAAELALFAVSTIVTTYLGRRFMPSAHLGGPDINDPHARLIGRQAEAAAAFEGGLGRVFVDGKEWSAELEGGGVAPPGAKLEVTALLGGARLRVRAR
jgi:membrane protein implicated in regulation of membrane protease activity